MSACRACGGVRLALGLLTLAAIGVQLGIQVRLGSSLVNFFSYFTNLANLFAAVVLILGARKAWEPSDPIRAMSVVNMAVVGIVFSVLLRDVDLGSLRPWINWVLHYVMPIAVLADWVVQPPKTTLRVRHLVRCLIFPALYLTYTLIRGAGTGWYPYPFLDPANVGGYGGVALYAVGITVTFLIAGVVLLGLGNRLSPSKTGYGR